MFLSGHQRSINPFFSIVVTVILFIAIAGCNKPKENAPASGLPLITTSEELDSAAARAGNKMVVLDFYADWCGPCRILAPTIDEIAGEYDGKAAFYRVNIDRSQALAAAFGVRGIPYVVFMTRRKPVYALTGLYPAENYKKVLDGCRNAGSSDDCVEQVEKNR